MMKRSLFALLASLPLVGCMGADQGGQSYETTTGALEPCVYGIPAITEVREERLGSVAPGIAKIYQVKVLNMNSAGCSPASFTFVPDSFHFISTTPQPATATGIASNAYASYRVEVKSDPSMAEGVYMVGFTIVNAQGGTSERGAFTFEINLTNPIDCYRQAPQVAVSPVSPAPVAAGTPQAYQVTVRNIDNRECGPDTFSIIPDSFHLFGLESSGSQPISAGGSMVFTVTATSAEQVLAGAYDLGFTVLGSRHGSLTNRGSVRYQVQ